MSGTSVRNRVEVDELQGLSRAERIDLLRARMAQISRGEDFSAATETVQLNAYSIAPKETLPVPQPLGKVLPGGGLARAAVTEVSDSPALITELIKATVEHGGYVAVVGWPSLSLAGVIEDLTGFGEGSIERIIAIPNPGADVLGILGVLAEGMDLIVGRWAVPLELSPVRVRPLLAKLRAGSAALVLVGARIVSPAARIEARVRNYRGIGAGSGRISAVDMEVTVAAKGQGLARVDLRVGQTQTETEHLARPPRLRVV